MTMMSRNVKLGSALELTSWRKVALGTWRTVGDPSIYGMMEVDAGPALAYIEKLRSQTGVKVTLSHFVGKAISETFAKHPEINVLQRFGTLYPRKQVDLFFQVASDVEGKDLSGATVRDADKKSVTDIARELTERVRAVRQEGDPSFSRMKGLMKLLPAFLTRFLLDASSFLLYTLNIYTPLLGTPRDPFGSVMITNIGSLGLNFAFAPLVPYSRVPILICIGTPVLKPVVDQSDGVLPLNTREAKVRVAPLLTLCTTIDHRLIDGVHAAKMCKTLQAFFENPEASLGFPEAKS